MQTSAKTRGIFASRTGNFLFYGFLCLWTAPPAYGASESEELFEKKVRPTLVAKCFPCHSSKSKSPMGGLVLDSKAGLLKGGSSGPVIVAGKPEESRLMRALRYSDPSLQMPPSGKLSDDVVQGFTEWIRTGAGDPRVDSSPVSASIQIDIEKGKKWWAFQPVKELMAPTNSNQQWAITKLDRFILAALEKNEMKPSPEADARTLVRRLYIDLTGIPPTYEESEDFVRNSSPAEYRKLVEKLLASPRYGERWARYWLDTARYAEDNALNAPSVPFYPFAWRYRDWLIEALNRDLPYDQFVKLQLAADQQRGVPRDDWRALGFLGIAPVVHKDLRLSADIIETFASDDWDERVDTVSRGILGLTVSCARCHDHKFDPIRAKDYYSLASVFASTSQVVRPMFEIDHETELRFLAIEQRLFEINYLASLLTREPGSDEEGSARRVAKFRMEAQRLIEEVDEMGKRYPQLPTEMKNYISAGSNQAGKIKPYGDQAPFMNAVYDAGQWIDGADSSLSIQDFRPGEPRDLRIFRRGNVLNQGELAPRGFPAVLSRGAETTFREGSGRKELAERIFTDAAPLAARVIVNRIWGWHFGKGLVETPSDFGVQGDKPSHPELLDDLAARFMANGWRLKWLHREIVLSSAYRQSSRPREQAMQLDPDNRLVWRYNPRRLDFEALRDSVLYASGALDEKLFGPSLDLEAATNYRRTLYARSLREKGPPLPSLYDVPDPSQHSPQRSLTTTSLQQLFVLNSPFFQRNAAALADRSAAQTTDREEVQFLYRRILSRDPSARETQLGTDFLAQAPLAQYAQSLLATNEFVFWP